MVEELAGIERQGGRQKRESKRKKYEEDELTETEKQRIQLQYLQWQSFVKDVGKRRTLAKRRR